MRLFGYYALHSFVNQVKKLFKTWMLVFLLICMLFGGLIGVGVAMLEDVADETDGEIIDSEEIVEEVDEFDEESFLEAFGIEPLSLVELVVGGIVLAVFVFEAVSAGKNGSGIFLPADVNLLFASPMKPQSVLLFRLMTQLGASILASVYLLLQVPNLTLNLGVSLWASLAAIAAWCLTIVLGKLIQLLIYTVCATHPQLKPWVRNGVYALLALIVAGFLLYWKGSGSYLDAAVGFFNSRISRYIPLWGWLKGFCLFALEGSLLGTLLCLTATLISGVALTYFIWHIKADFYEDALAKSEETAELLEQAQSEKAGAVIVKRKKDRSERLKRDGMRYGAGANVFFFKSMYNRFRFAHLGVFTKTSETYLVAAVGVGVLCRFVLQTDGLLPVALTLAGLSFFRALGNPLEQDTQMDYFILIPESTWKKLFWSLMGGTANCFLDVLPAMVVAVALLWANPLTALAWIPFIVSVDFFATTVGAFINLSAPVSAGKIVKQLIQIMFIYFGLLPDIAIMAVGMVLGHPAIGAVSAAAVNIVLGFLFFALTPLFLEPKDGKKFTENAPFAGDFKIAKRHFSRLGIGTFAILVIGSVAQILIMSLLSVLLPEWTSHPWGIWVATFAPIYVVAVPLGTLILRKAPAQPLEKHSLKAGSYFVAFIISVFMMYAGNLAGTILTSLLQAVLGLSAGNPIMSYAMDDSLLPKVLFMVILAPVIEEFIFRKQLIDRMHIYGEKTAVVVSALMFGLFHGNLSQLFYAFGLGLVFGYVYLKTGKLRYSTGLHMLINFLGSVLAPALLAHLDLSAFESMETLELSALQPMIPWLVGYAVYALALLGLAVAGLVLLCIKSRQLCFRTAALELPRGSRLKTVCCNPGMLLLIAACAALIVLTFL